MRPDRIEDGGRAVLVGVPAERSDEIELALIPLGLAIQTVDDLGLSLGGHGALPDLVVLGPRRAVQVCSAIRSSSWHPFVLVLGPDDEDLAVACLEAGADDYCDSAVSGAEIAWRAAAGVRRIRANCLRYEARSGSLAASWS